MFFAGHVIRIISIIRASEAYLKVGRVIIALFVPRPKEKDFNGVRVDPRRIHYVGQPDVRHMVDHLGRTIVDKCVIDVDHIAHRSSTVNTAYVPKITVRAVSCRSSWSTTPCMIDLTSMA